MALFGKRKAAAAQVGQMKALIRSSAADNAAGAVQAKTQLLELQPVQLIGSVRAVTLSTIPEELRKAPGFQSTLNEHLLSQSDIEEIQAAILAIGRAAIVNADSETELTQAIGDTFTAAVQAGTAAGIDMLSLPFFMIAEAFGKTLRDIGITELLDHNFGSAKQAE